MLPWQRHAVKTAAMRGGLIGTHSKEILHSQDTKDPVGAIADTISYGIWKYNKHELVYDLYRIHESGDFWSELYFQAWLEVARQHPNIKFYAYTKQLSYWLNAKE